MNDSTHSLEPTTTELVLREALKVLAKTSQRLARLRNAAKTAALALEDRKDDQQLQDIATMLRGAAE